MDVVAEEEEDQAREDYRFYEEELGDFGDGTVGGALVVALYGEVDVEGEGDGEDEGDCDGGGDGGQDLEGGAVTGGLGDGAVVEA